MPDIFTGGSVPTSNAPGPLFNSYADQHRGRTKVHASLPPEVWSRLERTETVHGKEWFLKALHPADTVLGATSVPDGSPQPTVPMQFETAFTITPPVGAVTNWDANIVLHQHPYHLGNVFKKLSTDANFTYVGGSTAVPLLGTAFGTTSLVGDVTGPNLWEILADNVEQYRMVYGSATLELDATSTTNSGHMVVAQYTSMPLMSTLSPLKYGAAGGDARVNPAGTTSYVGGIRINIDNATTLYPAYEQLPKMPGSFQGLAQEGAYVPYKMDAESMRWKQCADRQRYCSRPSGEEEVIEGGMFIPLTGVAGLPRFAGFDDGGIARGYFPTTDGGFAANAQCWQPDRSHGGERALVHPLFSHSMALLAVRGLNPAAQLTLRVRMGFEMIVTPNSLFAAHLQPAPVPDPRAIKVYLRMIPLLAAAYPAAYNDRNKLMSVIANLLKQSAPFMSMIPKIGMFLGPAATAAAAGIEAFQRPARKRDAKKTQKVEREVLSAAKALDKVRSQIATVSTNPRHPLRMRRR